MTNDDRRQLKFDFTVRWVSKKFQRILLRQYKIDTGKPWLLRKGRNWVSMDTYSETCDGWWMFGYRMWSPHLYLMPVALWYRWRKGESNFFYMRDRRKRIGLRW